MKIWERLFGKKEKPCTWEDFYRIQREVYAQQAREDALFDEYMALPDRPKIGRWMRVYETSEPHWEPDCVDTDDYFRWRKERLTDRKPGD